MNAETPGNVAQTKNSVVLTPTLIKLALGTTDVPTDDRDLQRLIVKQDKRDAIVDLDAFDRALRRAAKLEIAWARRLHKKAKQSWKKWVEDNLAGAYETAQRHRYVARLQAELLAHELPPLSDLSQARVIRLHAKAGTPIEALKAIANSNDGKLPSGTELEARLGNVGNTGEANVRPARERVVSTIRKAIKTAEQDSQDEVLKAHLPELKLILRGISSGLKIAAKKRRGQGSDDATPTLL